MYSSPRAIALTLLTLAAACGGPELGAAQSFEVYEVATEKNSYGEYVVEFDRAITTQDALREYWAKNVERVEGEATAESALQSGEFLGVTHKWSGSTAKALTYCVDKNGFTADEYDKVVEATRQAALAWERVADVRFAHDVAQDDDCPSSIGIDDVSSGWCISEPVVFRVVAGGDDDFAAADATFPNTPCGRVRIYSGGRAESANSLRQIMTHELGHTLGFMHEHGRNKNAGDVDYCVEGGGDTHTSYDRASIMHYWSCPGALSGITDEEVSARDAFGAAHVYGPSTLSPALLRMSNGHFVRTHPGRTPYLKEGGDTAGPRESFELIELGNGFVALRSDDRLYVRAFNNGGKLRADRLHLGSPETFLRLPVAGGKFVLRAYTHKFVRVTPDGVRADLSFAQAVGNPNAQFDIIDLEARPVALGAYNGTYVKTNSAGALSAGSTRIFRDESVFLVDLTDGIGPTTTVALRNARGHYAVVDGTKVKYASESIDQASTFTMDTVADGRVRFMTAGGGYLWTFGWQLATTGTQGGNKARFELIDLKGTDVNLRTITGWYWSAHVGGGSYVGANKKKAQGWQRFAMVELGEGRVALRTLTGQYVSIEHQVGSSSSSAIPSPHLVAMHDWIGAAETFERIDKGPGFVQLRANNGNLVVAPGTGGSLLLPAGGDFDSDAEELLLSVFSLKEL